MLFKKIDPSSVNSLTSALGFFETPPSNVGISSTVYRELLTLNPVDSWPFHFRIHPNSAFLDLSHIYLETEMRIERRVGNGDWTPIVEADKIGTVQGIGAVWIKNLRVTVNGRETFNANSLYSYKSYLDMELSYSPEVKENYLGIAGYFPMKPDISINQNALADVSYVKRKSCFEKGKTAQFFSKLNADIFTSDLYLINNVPVEIEIHPNTSNFLLLQLDAPVAPNPPEYRINYTSVKMYVKTVELFDGLALEIAQHLEKSPARYGIRRSEMKSVYVSGGRMELQTNLFSEQIPRRVVVGFVDSSAYQGDLKKSPFVFNHHNVREITITAGAQTSPNVLYNMDWSENSNKFMRAYNDFVEGLGLANSNESNGISPRHYKNGWAIFIFTLTSDLENNSGFELIKTGTTSIYVKFNSAIAASGVNMVVYGEFDSLLLLDKNRTLTSDLTVS